jgi:hypothetical protein
VSDKSELKPIPAATAQEPGLYAIHYLDNWDGEGDTYHILAELSADGIWSRHENGCKLLKYQGDEILQVWPLYDGAAQEPVAFAVFHDG